MKLDKILAGATKVLNQLDKCAEQEAAMVTVAQNAVDAAEQLRDGHIAEAARANRIADKLRSIVG